MYLMRSGLRAMMIVATVLGLTSAPLLAEMAQPSGNVILTVTGKIGETNADGAARFDLEMLQNLPATTIRTTTIWTTGQQTFVGVSLDAFLKAIDAKGSQLRATAINDYAVVIPVTDAAPGGPIIAYLLDGKEMSVRNKGPLWIVYPYDSSSDFRTEVIYSRSIWQLDRIDVHD